MTERRFSIKAPGGVMEEMTWVDVREAAAAGLPAVVAVGSTEQHGPHLPLNTDSILPAAIAARAGERTPLVVAPPIRFGARSRALSGGGESFPGTLSVRAGTLIATLTEVLEGLGRAGFTKICVQNWHFENTGLIWEACDLASEAHPGVRFLLLEDPMPSFTQEDLEQLFPSGFVGWDVEHASVMETSLMLAIYPDLVRRDQIADDAAERHPSWDLVPAPPEFVPASGVLSRAGDASAEIGEKFLEAISGRLLEALATEFDCAVA
ncbi:MAG: creatininase [Actinobacteria bacterium]|nr:creatininase [Actinomycetota bacterium]